MTLGNGIVGFSLFTLDIIASKSIFICKLHNIISSTMICDVTYELLIDKVQVPVLRSLDKIDLVHTTYNNLQRYISTQHETQLLHLIRVYKLCNFVRKISID